MLWPLDRKPIPASQIPFYNLHYLCACGRPADPTMLWGTDVPAEQLTAYVRERNRGGTTLISVAHVLVQAVGRALKDHPEFNRRIVGRRIYAFREVNVRMMAYNRSDGEVDVMLIRGADTLSLERIARGMWKIQHRAAAGGIPDQEDKHWLRRRFPGPLLGWVLRAYLYLDSRFNLPKAGRIDRAGCSPVVVNYLAFSGSPPMRVYKPSKYPHESTSLGVTLGRVERVPVVRESGVEVGQVAPLYVRADHRIVSAYQLAQFTSTLRRFLMEPAQMEAGEAAATGGEAADAA
ncbi:MAG: 2-oxo acid dehydrogenase subunit E2 [Planctomycetes bacterium]|nr:2-oxo acid dehydrogenase subunit E2 [Planctomycetota bacterium]